MAQKLSSFQQVVDVFGGPTVLASMVGQKPPSIWNWQHKRGRFPSKFYRSMTAALASQGYSAPPELWGQVKLRRARSSPSLQRAA